MKILKKVGIVVFILNVVLLLSVGILYLVASLQDSFNLNSLQEYYLFDTNGNQIQMGKYASNWVNLEDVSPYFIDAVISTEDKHFYTHHGFDYLRILKTFIANIKANEIVGGASTISQQYVKNLYLTFDKTWDRKIEEAWLTLQLETHFSKDEILEGYINTINFGQGNYGVENASQYYFGHSANELTEEEAYLLAGIPKSPSYFNPVSHYDTSIERAKVVVNSLVRNGKLSQEEADTLYQSDLTIVGKRSESYLDTYLYYEDLIEEEIANIPNLPSSALQTGGLKIYTSFDVEAQTLLENAIDQHMSETDMQVASVIIEPSTGNILALVGGKDYKVSQYNRGLSMERQVGSTMKPFLYYAALANGMTGSSKFLSEETTFVFSGNETYSPSNYNQKYANQEITMATALSYSDNIYAVKTHLFLGMDALPKVAKLVGIQKELPEIPSLPLGTVELSLLDFATGYTTLASGGYKKEVSCIQKITDQDGNILYEKGSEEQLVLDTSYTYILNELLTTTYNSAFTNYNKPTLSSIASQLSHKYSLKTGSTGTDYWIVGYNPNILMLVWTGFDDNSQTISSETVIPRKIWVDTIEPYLENKEVTWYETPSNVVGVLRDALTGGDVTSSQNSYLYYYVKGSEMGTNYVYN